MEKSRLVGNNKDNYVMNCFLGITDVVFLDKYIRNSKYATIIFAIINKFLTNKRLFYMKDFSSFSNN